MQVVCASRFANTLARLLVLLLLAACGAPSGVGARRHPARRPPAASRRRVWARRATRLGYRRSLRPRPPGRPRLPDRAGRSPIEPRLRQERSPSPPPPGRRGRSLRSPGGLPQRSRAVCFGVRPGPTGGPAPAAHGRRGRPAPRGVQLPRPGPRRLLRGDRSPRWPGRQAALYRAGRLHHQRGGPVPTLTVEPDHGSCATPNPALVAHGRNFAPDTTIGLAAIQVDPYRVSPVRGSFVVAADGTFTGTVFLTGCGPTTPGGTQFRINAVRIDGPVNAEQGVASATFVVAPAASPLPVLPTPSPDPR